MHGFCFSQPGKELHINYPDPGTDFFLFLSLYAEQNGITHIAMTLEDMRKGGEGVKDLLAYGHQVVIVDAGYSPLDDDNVLPLMVHRMESTLEKAFPNCVVIGGLIPRLQQQRRLEKLKAYFQDGEPAYPMNAFRSGWVVRSTTGNANRMNSRVYEYVKTRDYELETSNAKRRK
ncbi:hypothetical protein DEEACLCL_00143 [Salmonella phage CRW-SP2]|nr:hypothetical protein DEEACLCL_00143 [Salmonella phage CRW-SP2]